MKLISWNVNGLRACVGKGFGEFFTQAGADIFCMQETKMQQEQNTFAFTADSGDVWHEYWNDAEKKGYSGTLTLTTKEPRAFTRGIGVPEHDHEGRVVTLQFENFYMVNVYTPNSQRELARLPYRMTWEDAFRAYLLALDRDKPVIVCGDLNVAHTEMDIKNAKSNVKNAGFTPQEREKMTELLASGFVDSFRYLHPDVRDAYTWWSYMASARERNIGWRIDYFLVSERIKDKILSAGILPQVFGSDHCPVVLEMAL